MRTQFTRIPDMFGRGSSVVEHVSVEALAEAWVASVRQAGIDPARPDVADALHRLVGLANAIAVSTPGSVYRADYAAEDLARALAPFGVAPARSPIRDRVFH
ncbi:MAG: hypothetical protein MIN69_00250 [Methylorubrum extorquens]|jgi:hypothetical protein|uniref:hypothetical protein n=1 Tax=Methylorubrum extorquens TaxID=408 RepID=UPI002FEE2F24